MLIAPSGSGKTVAVQAYIRRSASAPARAHWYSAFGESLETIWRRLCSVIAKIDEKTAVALQSLSTPGRESLSEIAEIMQGINCPVPTVFVIDNYQTIQNGAPYELLLALSQHGNGNLHIVVIAQHLDEGALPLSAPHIAKLGAQHFLFDEAETKAYAEHFGFRLTGNEIRELMQYTSGWISAIRLQLLHYQLTGCLGKNQGVDQLLRLVVWERLDCDAQAFMAALSLLASVSPGQISCMLSNADTGGMVRLLNQLVFVSFDPDSQCYILQSILREFLRERFNEYPDAEKKMLYRRAGEAQRFMGELFPALRFFERSGDHEAALSMRLRNRDLAGIELSEIDAALAGIMTECPHATLVKYPDFFLVFAFELYIRGERAGFDRCRKIVLEALRSSEDNNQIADTRRIRGEYHILSSLSAFNDIRAMSGFHRAALADLGGPSGLFDFSTSWTPASPSVLYMYWRDSGRLLDEIALLERHLPAYYALTNGHGTGGPALMHAEAVLNSGKLSVAESLCHKAVYLASPKQQDNVCLGAEFALARIAILRGDPEEYKACLCGLRGRLLAGKENALRPSYDLCLSWLSLCLGTTDDIPNWLMGESAIRERVYGLNASFAMLVYANILLSTRDYNKLFGIAEVLLERAESIPIQLARVYYCIYIACAKISTGDQADAVKHLHKALDIALADQIYLPFAEHWMWLTNVLLKMKPTLADQQGIDRIISMCAKQRLGVTRIRKALSKSKKTLTARELEIVQLVKQGKTNKEIADMLFVTPETVKMALKKIFLKLNVRSRFQL